MPAPYRDPYISKALELSASMIVLAEEGEEHAMDDNCRLLYGLIRDYAYQIRTRAERERFLHYTADTK